MTNVSLIIIITSSCLIDFLKAHFQHATNGWSEFIAVNVKIIFHVKSNVGVIING